MRNSIGKTFHHLTVAEPIPNPPGLRRNAKVLARCECGSVKEYFLCHLKNGNTKSCGCMKLNVRVKHGGVTTKEYRAWQNMKQRCLNPQSPSYPNFGGRGITVCEEWLAFENFIADMGACPDGVEISRLDNDAGYDPQNCVWGPKKGKSKRRARSF